MLMKVNTEIGILFVELHVEDKNQTCSTLHIYMKNIYIYIYEI